MARCGVRASMRRAGRCLSNADGAVIFECPYLYVRDGMAEASATREHARRLQEPGGFALRLLVVEDDPDLNRQLTTALSDAGYVVDRAFDGEEGHYLGESEPYDAI